MMRRLLATLRQCRDDERGVTAVEFALAGPVLLVMLLGIFDIGHMTYVMAALNGAVQRVARDATLEGADVTTQDAFVTTAIQRVAPSATVTTTRKSYFDFTEIAQPEPWNDSNANGRCDNSESFAMFTCAGCFYCGVKSEKVCLECYFVNYGYNVTDFFA